MTIPDYQTVMLPLLRLAADGQEHSLREAIERLADEFGLNEEERKELLPSGSQATFDNRVGWARSYMKKAGLIEYPRRGYFRIIPKGHEALEVNPNTQPLQFSKLPIKPAHQALYNYIITEGVPLRERGRGRGAEGVFMSKDVWSLAVVGANLFRNGEAVGGRMTITNRGVLFEPHLLNFQRRPLELLYEDISEVREGGRPWDLLRTAF